jgi:hypothetical protein
MYLLMIFIPLIGSIFTLNYSLFLPSTDEETIILFFCFVFIIFLIIKVYLYLITYTKIITKYRKKEPLWWFFYMWFMYFIALFIFFGMLIPILIFEIGKFHDLLLILGFMFYICLPKKFTKFYKPLYLNKKYHKKLQNILTIIKLIFNVPFVNFFLTISYLYTIYVSQMLSYYPNQNYLNLLQSFRFMITIFFFLWIMQVIPQKMKFSHSIKIIYLISTFILLAPIFFLFRFFTIN